MGKERRYGIGQGWSVVFRLKKGKKEDSVVEEVGTPAEEEGVKHFVPGTEEFVDEQKTAYILKTSLRQTDNEECFGTVSLPWMESELPKKVDWNPKTEVLNVYGELYAAYVSLNLPIGLAGRIQIQNPATPSTGTHEIDILQKLSLATKSTDIENRSEDIVSTLSQLYSAEDMLKALKGLDSETVMNLFFALQEEMKTYLKPNAQKTALEKFSPVLDFLLLLIDSCSNHLLGNEKFCSEVPHIEEFVSDMVSLLKTGNNLEVMMQERESLKNIEESKENKTAYSVEVLRLSL